MGVDDVVHDWVGGADVADAVAEQRRGVIAGDAFGELDVVDGVAAQLGECGRPALIPQPDEFAGGGRAALVGWEVSGGVGVRWRCSTPAVV